MLIASAEGFILGFPRSILLVQNEANMINRVYFGREQLLHNSAFKGKDIHFDKFWATNPSTLALPPWPDRIKILLKVLIHRNLRSYAVANTKTYR